MYKPYLIAAGFESGLETDREPWLLPQDALSRLENAHLWRGQIIKRPTAKFFTKPGTKVIAEPLGIAVAGSTLAGNVTSGVFGPVGQPFTPHAKIANLPMVPLTHTTLGDPVNDNPLVLTVGPFKFRPFPATYPLSVPPDDPDSYYLEGMPGFTPAAAFQAAINFRTGEWFVSLAGGPDVFTATQALATYEFYRGLPEMLITEWVNAANTRELVVCDTKRLFVWNPGRQRFDDKLATVATLATDDVWTGGVTDFFDSEVVDDGSARLLVIVNGVNLPKKWSGVALADMGVSTEFTAARFVFAQYGFVIYLVPTIGGAQNHQRAMWTDQFLTETVQPVNYAVIYTGERIRTAHMVNDEIVVLCDHSVYKLRNTGDFRPGSQFEWVHIAGGSDDKQDTVGGLAAMGRALLDDKLLAISAHGLVQASGVGAAESNPKVPDLMTRWLDPTRMSISYAITFDEERKVIFSAVSPDAIGAEPNRALTVDMDTGALSFYDWRFRIFGLFRRQGAVPAWDDVSWKDTPLDDVFAIVDGVGGQAGYPTILAGTLNGDLYEIPSDSGVDELGESTMVAEFKRLNPFIGDGLKVDFGWLLLHGSPASGEEVQVSVYKNNETAPWRTYTVPLDAPPGKSRIAKRIKINSIADFHRIKVEQTGTSRWAIDALIPYFQPGGDLEGAV